jgi:hypothetical protein
VGGFGGCRAKKIRPGAEAKEEKKDETSQGETTETDR